MVENHHPHAGKPGYYTNVGCPTGCLPCAEQRAAGREKLIADLIRWAEGEMEALSVISGRHGGILSIDSKRDELKRVVDKIRELEEIRRVELHAASIRLNKGELEVIP